MKIDGACHCNKISFEAEIEPDNVIICHCTDCQTLSGSAYRVIAAANPGTFKFLSGEAKTYIKIAEDGTPRAQVFCGDCATPIYAGPVEGESGMLGIRVGTISQRDQLTPRKQFYRRSEQRWAQDLSSLPSIATD